VEIERFASDGTPSSRAAEPFATRLVGLPDGRTSLRIPDVFPSTRGAFGAGSGYSNTMSSIPESPPASARVRIVFDAPVSATAMATPPFDPFILVRHGSGDSDVHLPGHAGFAGRPAELPIETGPDAFLDQNGSPWALLVPYDWRYPLEAMRIGDTDPTKAAYPAFHSWVSSRGANGATWYTTPSAPKVTGVLTDAVRTRPWSVVAGGAP
jgi:LruC domain-containing protein